MDALRGALQGDSSVTLDAAALELARIEYPKLDPAPWLAELDQIAAELGVRLGEESGGSRFVQIANDYLFGELEFRGNQTQYDDPRNSCLNQVLERRIGLPITLSVVYIEVARRLKTGRCSVSVFRGTLWCVTTTAFFPPTRSFSWRQAARRTGLRDAGARDYRHGTEWRSVGARAGECALHPGADAQ